MSSSWLASGKKVAAQRKGIDYAECLCDLVDIHWPKTEKIRIIQDNLNTHQGASWYKAFAAPEAGGIFRKLEFRDRLKHASWLNIAEIEIDVLGRQCTDRGLGD